jgi:adenylylsulfate kinase-like enzyme
MADAGVTALASLVSPFRSDRAAERVLALLRA